MASSRHERRPDDLAPIGPFHSRRWAEGRIRGCQAPTPPAPMLADHVGCADPLRAHHDMDACDARAQKASDDGAIIRSSRVRAVVTAHGNAAPNLVWTKHC